MNSTISLMHIFCLNWVIRLLLHWDILTISFISLVGQAKGMGRGTQSIISRKLGEKDYKKSNEVALSGILLIILLCVIFQLAILFLLPHLLATIGNKTSIPVIISYITCLSIFVFPLLISEYMTELLNAEGHSQTATNIMAIGTVLNIIFDYVLICIFDMGIIGSSLGTTIAYVGTFIIFFYMYIIENRFIIKINIRKIKFRHLQRSLYQFPTYNPRQFYCSTTGIYNSFTSWI